MKKAYFTYKGNPTGRKSESVHGSVTLKNDGKISISLSGLGYYSFAAKHHAKLLANEIVAANFTHAAITDMEVKESDADIISALLQHTAELKTRWIERTRAYITKTWDWMEKQDKMTSEEWYSLYSIKTTIKKDYAGKEYASPEKGSYESKDYTEMRNRQHYVRKTLKAGLDKYTTTEINNANSHYLACIEKLAFRLKEKGLTRVEDLTVKHGWVGVNLEMLFEFNGTIVKAQTITAEGPIQRAHYRYLIK